MAQETAKSVTLLAHTITDETVRQVIKKASAIKWGMHLRRWRYFNVHHEGVTYHRNSLISSGLWHLLKRVHVDQEWPIGTSLDDLNEDARSTIQHSDSDIYVYGYYRTNPPRLQWAFLNPLTGIAVVYDMDADLIATVFKPTEGALFFKSQINAVKIDRKGWNV